MRRLVHLAVATCAMAMTGAAPQAADIKVGSAGGITGPIAELVAAIVKGRYKRHLVGGKPGLSGPEFYDLFTDPREQFGQMLPMFPAKGMFNIMMTRHLLWKERFPDAEVHSFPDAGHYILEDAREEVIPLITRFLEEHPIASRPKRK